MNWQLQDFYEPVICLQGVEKFPGDKVKYQDVGDRGDPSTDGILNKLDEIACLVAEQLIDDIHRLDNGSDL